MDGKVFSKKCIKLGPGTRVELRDLQSKPELNGTVVTCKAFDSEKMRWAVEMADGTSISVKMKNIRPLPETLDKVQSEIVTVPLVEELNRPRDFKEEKKIEEVEEQIDESQNTDDKPMSEDGKDGSTDVSAPDVSNEEEFPALDPSCLPAAPPCLWSQDSKAEDWAKALRMNEPKFTSLLVVPNRQFTEEDQEVLFSALQENTVLEELSIAPCHSLAPRGVDALVEALAVNRTIRKLQLGGKKFTDDVAVALSTGIARNESLRTLDFGKSKITDKGLASIISALGGRVMDELVFQDLNIKSLPALCARKVDLTSCRLKDASVPALQQLVTGHCRELNLTDNKLSQDGLYDLLHVLDATSPLTHLNLNENAMGDDGMAGIVEALKAGWRVDTLSLSACDLQEEEALELSEAIMLYGRIRVLKIRDNNLRTEIIEKFARRAPAELDVANNKAETTKVLRAFRDTDIEKLNLQANNGANLAEMTGDLGLRHLTELDLANNQIPCDSVLGFIDRLTKDKNVLPALEVCVVGGNVTDPNVIAEPAQHLCETRNGLARFIFEVK